MDVSSFDALAAAWEDTPEAHDRVLHACDAAVAGIVSLADHRAWVEKHQHGFGHRAFHWAWWLLAQHAPGMKFLELGVHKGQALSAVSLAAGLQGRLSRVHCYGVSPMNGVDGDYYDKRSYFPDLVKIWKKWNTPAPLPSIICGLTEDLHAKESVAMLAPFDAVYVDACHDYKNAKHDLEFYAPLVAHGGYLLADDAGHGLNLTGWHFKGYEGASQACRELLPPHTPNPDWQYITNLMHLRIWRRL